MASIIFQVKGMIFMKKRRAETLAEFLMASLVFGLVMAGTFEFIANQTEFIARINVRDEIMQQAQFSMDYYYYTYAKSTSSPKKGILSSDRAGLKFSFDDDNNPKVLTVSKGTKHTMTFAFKE